MNKPSHIIKFQHSDQMRIYIYYCMCITICSLIGWSPVSAVESSTVEFGPTTYSDTFEKAILKPPAVVPKWIQHEWRVIGMTKHHDIGDVIQIDPPKGKLLFLTICEYYIRLPNGDEWKIYNFGKYKEDIYYAHLINFKDPKRSATIFLMRSKDQDDKELLIYNWRENGEIWPKGTTIFSRKFPIKNMRHHDSNYLRSYIEAKFVFNKDVDFDFKSWEKNYYKKRRSDAIKAQKELTSKAEGENNVE